MSLGLIVFYRFIFSLPLYYTAVLVKRICVSLTFLFASLSWTNASRVNISGFVAYNVKIGFYFVLVFNVMFVLSLSYAFEPPFAVVISCWLVFLSVTFARNFLFLNNKIKESKSIPCFSCQQ